MSNTTDDFSLRLLCFPLDRYLFVKNQGLLFSLVSQFCVDQQLNNIVKMYYMRLGLNEREKKEEIIHACLECIFYLKRVQNQFVLDRFSEATYISDLLVLDSSQLIEVLFWIVKNCSVVQLRGLYDTHLKLITTAICCIAERLTETEIAPDEEVYQRIMDHSREINGKLIKI